MSLYSFNFQLLPRPQRSPLAWGEESTRAILPNFENVESMNRFLYHLFTYEFSHQTFTQIKIGIALLSSMLIVSSLIIVRRMYERNFWIIRIIRVPSGPIIVPNPILSFVFIESNFVVVLIAFLIVNLEYHEYHTLQPRNLILWCLLPWCITIFGAIFAAVGTHYATPTRQIHIPNTRKEKISVIIGNLLNNAWVINCMAIALPAFICITVAVPTFIGNYHFMQGQNEYSDWKIKYANAQTFTQPMVIEAQEIWFKVLYGTQIAASVFCLWFVWAFVCFLIHSFFSFKLLRLIKEELRSSDIVAPRFVVTTTRMVSSNPMAANFMHEESQISATYRAHGRRRTTTNGSFFGQSADEPCLPPIAPTTDNSSLSKLDHENNEDDSVHMDVGVNPNRKKKSIFSFLPNLIMTAEKHERRLAESMRSSRDEQKVELRKAGMYILIQYLIIGPGCATFGGIALLMAFTLHGSYCQPLNDGTATYFQRFGAVALLSVTYVVIVFGLVCITAIFHRTYEPVFVNYSITATISSFGFAAQTQTGGDRNAELRHQTSSYPSRLKNFIIVGGANSQIRNKLRYPQAMVQNLIGKKHNEKSKNIIRRTVAEEISYQSSKLSENEDLHRHHDNNKNSFQLPMIKFKPTIFKPNHPKRFSGRQFNDYYLYKHSQPNVDRRRNSEFLEAEPQEGELVQNSLVFK